MADLLRVTDLRVALPGRLGDVEALRGIHFAMKAGERIGIVGESGCGKSMTALALMGLLPDQAKASGEILFQGQDIMQLSDGEWCGLRGNHIAMIFQEPMTSLNPLHPIGRQIAEPLRLHQGLGGDRLWAKVIALLDRVGIVDAAARLGAYPHQFSGGQRQRIMIAMALACAPALLIADEPTTALDVTIQGQILELINQLVAEMQMGLILISHDLGVIGQNVDRICVMYGGRIVEQGPTNSLRQCLAHPYSQGLFNAVPQLGQGRRRRLQTIDGVVPDLEQLAAGCGFYGRCPLQSASCAERVPAPQPVALQHSACCHHLELALQSAAQSR